MQIFPQKAPKCATKTDVFTSHIKYRIRWALLLFYDPRQRLPNLSDQQARDIGLDTAELEWRRLRLPSQNTHHPYG